MPLKVVLALVILVGVIDFFAPKALSSFFEKIASPFWNLEKTVMYEGKAISIQNIIKENEELKKDSETNEARLIEVSSIERENKALKEILGRKDLAKYVLTEILKKPPFSAYDVFIIDIGSDLGVKEKDKVYALGNIPIGEIAEVGKNISKVRLYSTNGEKLEVFIGDQNIQASAMGRGGGSFEASLPRDSKISVGDSVHIPSLGNSFIAKVEDIISEPSNPFSTILFKQPVNIYNLRWLVVETDGK